MPAVADPPGPDAAFPRSLAAALADLVLPTPCAGCGEPSVRFCPGCRARFSRPAVRAVDGLPPVLVVAPYAGPARRAVLAYKERGRRDLARPLAASVAHALAGLASRRRVDGPGPGGPATGSGLPPRCLVVPAPSRRSAARARGGDHMLRLARALATHTARTVEHPANGPRVARALALRAGARDSVGLDEAARAANLAAHLRVRRGALPERADRDRPALLLDDVLTTGATARAGVDALAGAGVDVGLVVVLTAVGGRVAGPQRAAGAGASRARPAAVHSFGLARRAGPSRAARD